MNATLGLMSLPGTKQLSTLFNDTITVAVWTGFHVSSRLYAQYAKSPNGLK
jgi:hypothetical protein